MVAADVIAAIWRKEAPTHVQPLELSSCTQVQSESLVDLVAAAAVEQLFALSAVPVKLVMLVATLIQTVVMAAVTECPTPAMVLNLRLPAFPPVKITAFKFVLKLV